jgi:hypothetical protein
MYFSILTVKKSNQIRVIGFNLDVISIENEKMSGVGVLSKNTGSALVSIVLGPSDYPRTADNSLPIKKWQQSLNSISVKKTLDGISSQKPVKLSVPVYVN